MSDAEPAVEHRPPCALEQVQVGISAELADPSREYMRFWEWAPSRSLLASIRGYQRHRFGRSPVSLVARAVAIIRHRFWSVVTGADIPINSQIAGGFAMPHPNGIVIHPTAKIGPNCMFFQQVTVGVANHGVPTICGHVDVGAGAKILGPVTVGAHAVIGANAVVVDDVPPGVTVVGVPARPVSKKSAS